MVYPQVRMPIMWSSSSNSPSRVSRSGCWRRPRCPPWMAGALLLLTVGVASAEGLDPREQAEALLERYFSALQTGNVAVLGQVLGGELRAARVGLLHNPEYGLELVRSYAESEFDIVQMQVLGSGDVLATVDTWLGASERLRSRLTLSEASATKGYRIVNSESVPLTPPL